PRSQIGRNRGHELVHLIERAVGADARQPHHRRPVRTLERTRLYRLPVHRVQRRAQQRRQRRFSYAGVRPGNKEVMSHARPATPAAASEPCGLLQFCKAATRVVTCSLVIRAVSDNLSRAVPAATVGGLIAFTANPRSRKNAAAASASSFEPMTTGTICDADPPT